MSISDRINKLRDGLLTVTPRVYRARAHKTAAPYIVWMEDGAGDALRANGMTGEQPISGTIHLFESETTTETLSVAVQKMLNGLECAWQLGSIQHEQDTGLVHYEWAWEVC